MFWHPESEAFTVIIIFRIPAKKAALVSRWRWAASAEQCEQAEQGNIFVHGSSHFSAISLKEADRSEYCFGALITNMPACALTFCTNAKRSARAHKSLLRSRWHLEFWRIIGAACQCALRPPHTRIWSFSACPAKKIAVMQY